MPTHMGVWMWTHITEKFKGLSQSHVQHAYTFSKELIKTVTEMLWRKHKHNLAVRDYVMLMWIVHHFLSTNFLCQIRLGQQHFTFIKK